MSRSQQNPQFHLPTMLYFIANSMLSDKHENE